MKLYLSADCPTCDEPIYMLIETHLEQNGRPVVPIDTGAQAEWHCTSCKAKSVTGDIEAVIISG